MNKEIELIDLEEVKYIYKAVTNIGRHKDSPKASCAYGNVVVLWNSSRRPTRH